MVIADEDGDAVEQPEGFAQGGLFGSRIGCGQGRTFRVWLKSRLG